MAVQGPSKTALRVAALRAVHQIVDQTPKILVDLVVLKLLDPTYVEGISRDSARYQMPQSLRLRAHVLIRSRFAEDRLALAVRRGVRQFLLLGAGFDTFAYRQPDWARQLRIFEVDQPQSQREKRERLTRAGIWTPSNVKFVPIDFEQTSLAKGLRASAFDPAQPTFISWLGVMVYLSQDAIDEVLRFVVSLPRGSEIVLSFTQPPPQGMASRLADRAAALGEPWKTRLTAGELVQYLRDMGFLAVTVPPPSELGAYYIGQRQDGLHLSPRSNLASAIV